MTNFQTWDIKYFHEIHCSKQRALWNTPLSYAAFTKRLKKMNLHDAIYTPRVEYNVRDHTPKAPIQDSIRRRATMKAENIQVIDLDELWKLQEEKMQEVKQQRKPRVKMPKPKRTLLEKFIWLFR